MNKLFRSRTNSRLTGLCGGLAEWMNFSPTFIRLAVVIAAFCSFGTVLLIYFIASLIIPKEPYGHYDFHQTHHNY
ncbi:hypothetical protein PAESOLCIP111_03628 [Paenibacillus solanacearum]|uniref:Phage shock protein PspC N-terminal domain-containing protein n=1 Tax=Paenibacillus solanacearum TaxID=2048548 RepID=A0A916K2V8_9BACL|nr:PspC domain-containing protein [Paenibacillus solanacearum]CAG7635125.1 hypothetical protein PAESOLCIP111_03628 [Paenibacillus solanacearum]